MPESPGHHRGRISTIQVGEITTGEMRSLALKTGLILQGAIGNRSVSKWEDWERAHAEQDARDRYIVIAILIVVVALVLASNLMAS